MQVLKIEVGYLRYKQSPLCAPELLFLGKVFFYISVCSQQQRVKVGVLHPETSIGDCSYHMSYGIFLEKKNF